MTDNNKNQNKTEKKDPEKILHDTVMNKLKKAIDLNKLNNRTKESRQAKAEACALLLVAIRAGIQFDLNDPAFQIFVQKQSWRDAMERVCKDVCDPTTAIARGVMEVINLIPALDTVGNLLEKITNIFNKATKREDVETYNHDLWNDFYDDLPKDNGDGPNTHRNPEKNFNSKLQTFLSKRVIGPFYKNDSNGDIQRFLSERASKSKRLTSPNKRQLPKAYAGLSKNNSMGK